MTRFDHLLQAARAARKSCPHCGLTIGQGYGGTPACEGAWGGSAESHREYLASLTGCILQRAADGRPAQTNEVVLPLSKHPSMPNHSITQLTAAQPADGQASEKSLTDNAHASGETGPVVAATLTDQSAAAQVLASRGAAKPERGFPLSSKNQQIKPVSAAVPIGPELAGAIGDKLE